MTGHGAVRIRLVWLLPMRRGDPASMQTTILKGFSGILQVDGYAGYNRLLKRPAQDVTLAYCWAHARRKLHDVTQSGAAPIAQEGLAQIQSLYRIEKDLRGQCLPTNGASARQERSKPIIDAFALRLAQSRARVSAQVTHRRSPEIHRQILGRD